MPTSSRLARSATVLLVLLACPAAVAQQGPIPGEDPFSYAAAYVQGQAGQATADPAGYAQRTATPQGVRNATGEAGYVACWAAFEAGQSLDAVCAQFFTPPGTAPRPAPEADPEVAEADEAVAEALDLANTTLDAVQGIVEEPASAPSQLDRILQAAAAFVQGVSSIVVATLEDLLAGIGSLASGLATALDAVTSAGAAGFGALRDAGIAGFQETATGFGHAGSAMAEGVDAVGRKIADASSSAGDVISGAAAAAGEGIGQAGQAVADAAAAVGHAVADVAKAVADAVGSLFQGDAESHASAGDEAGPVPVPKVDAESLLDDLAGSLPA